MKRASSIQTAQIKKRNIEKFDNHWVQSDTWNKYLAEHFPFNNFDQLTRLSYMSYDRIFQLIGARYTSICRGKMHRTGEFCWYRDYDENNIYKGMWLKRNLKLIIKVGIASVALKKQWFVDPSLRLICTIFMNSKKKANNLRPPFIIRPSLSPNIKGSLILTESNN